MLRRPLVQVIHLGRGLPGAEHGEPHAFLLDHVATHVVEDLGEGDEDRRVARVFPVDVVELSPDLGVLALALVASSS